MPNMKFNPIQLSLRNKDFLHTNAGCYYCLNTFEVKKIKEWTDNGKTALCPFCGVDAVIPDEIDKKILQNYHDQGFGSQMKNE